MQTDREVSDPPLNVRVDLSARKLTRLLAAVFLILLAMHLLVVFIHFALHKPVRALTFLFDMDLEANVPVFFNTALFFIAAVTFFMAGRIGTRYRMQWLLLAATFLFLGVDESSQIHERFMLPTLRIIDPDNEGVGWLYYAWVIPYGLAALLLVLFLGRFMLHLPSRTRNGLIIGGAVYVLGAIVMELWSGREARAIHDTGLYGYPPYVIAYTLEECLEMIGLMICIHAMMGHLGRAGARLDVRILNPDERRAAE